MTSNLRQKEILRLMEEHGSVSVRDLTRQLYVSEATVRRDLSELERIGALKRTFGGATPILDTKQQIPLFIRESMDAQRKNALCKQAAELVRDGDTIFIDGSSTLQALAKYLSPRKDIIAITYSIKTAELLCRNHIKTYCSGGMLIENSLVCTGPKAIDFAKNINVDICFLSCKGVDRDGTFTDTSEEETSVRRAFLENAKTRVCLMTENKIGKRYLHTLCRAEEIDVLLSDGELPPSLRARLRKDDKI